MTSDSAQNSKSSLAYQALSFCARLAKALPRRWFFAIGRMLGSAVFFLDFRHRRLVLSHLRLAFPESPQRWLRDTARRFFRRMGEGACEFLCFWRSSQDECRNAVEVAGQEESNALLRRGKGMIILSAHYGNWEALATLGSLMTPGYETCAVGRSSGNPGVDRFLREVRGVGGMRIFPKDNALKNLLGFLRRGQVACFLADQIAGAEGTEVQFLGRRTWAITTPAYLSLKTGAPIVPAFVERIGTGRHRITYAKAIEPHRRGTLEEDAARMTREGMAALERFVRHRPDHWFWLHRRWKSKRARKEFQDSYRICVFTPHWIGDTVMALPALKMLRRLFPDAHVALAYPEGMGGLIDGLRLADERIPYGWSPKGFSLRGRLDLIQRLRRGYDMALLMPNSLDSALLAWMGGIRHRVGYAAYGRGPLLTKAIHNRSLHRHHAKRYQRLVEELGEVACQPMPEYQADPRDRQWVEDLLRPAGEKRLVGLHPGATYGPTKRWFPGRFVQLAERLADEGMQVVMLGSQQEREAIGPLVQGNAPWIDAMGQTDLGRLMALLKRMDVVVANDSGPMHMAALAGTPTVAIFGSTDPEQTAPLGISRIVRKPVACSPCLKRECHNADNPLQCLDTITVEDARKAVHEVLSKSLRGHVPEGVSA